MKFRKEKSKYSSDLNNRRFSFLSISGLFWRNKNGEQSNMI